MTNEEKQLLMQDLCARLPYGVIVDYKENEFEFPHWKIKTIHQETLDGWIGYDKRVGAGSESGSRQFKIGEVKPYLRSMSSMTEEEQIEFRQLIDSRLNGVDWKPWSLHDKTGIKNGIGGETLYFYDIDFIYDYLNSHHFDYRGLIEKGLAIKVTEDNNPYKNN